MALRNRLFPFVFRPLRIAQVIRYNEDFVIFAQKTTQIGNHFTTDR